MPKAKENVFFSIEAFPKNHIVVLYHIWTSTVSHSNVLCHVVATRICFHRPLIHLPSIFPRSLSNTEPPSDMSSTKYSIWPASGWSFNTFSKLIHSSYGKLVKKLYYFLPFPSRVESRPAKRHDVPESPSSPTQLTWPPLHTNVIHTHHFWKNNALASSRHL